VPGACQEWTAVTGSRERLRALRVAPVILTGFAMLAVSDGCGSDPDPRDIDGAIATALQHAEAGDAGHLFRVIDQRARHAMASIQQDRSEARRLVRASYPPATRDETLRSLGDAAGATSAADLFARRCDGACLAGLVDVLRAPASVQRDGDDATISTVHGGTFRMHRGNDGWWGLVWHTDELEAERNRAARDLEQIRANASVYERRRALGDPW